MKRLLLGALAIGVVGLAVGVSAVLMAGSPDANASPNDDPFQGGTTISTEVQQKEEFQRMVREEAIQLHYWLGVLADPATPCPSPCERVTDPVQIWTVLESRCERLDPSGLIAIATAVGPDDRQLTSALSAACDEISAALRSGGTPIESAEWRAKAGQADASLATAKALFESALGGTQ